MHHESHGHVTVLTLLNRFMSGGLPDVGKIILASLHFLLQVTIGDVRPYLQAILCLSSSRQRQCQCTAPQAQYRRLVESAETSRAKSTQEHLPKLAPSDCKRFSPFCPAA